MRIFVVGPDIRDTFSRNVAHTFRSMGHEVRTDPRDRGVRRSVLGRGLDGVMLKASRWWRLRGDERAVRIAREFKPQLTVVCTSTLEPESIESLRRVSGGLVVCWYGDPPANLERGHLLSGEYDAVFTKDPDFVERLRGMLGIAAYHLLEACNPDWHRPVAERTTETVVIAGTAYGYRSAMLLRLLQAGIDVRLYGLPPPLWLQPEVAAVHSRVLLDHTNKARTFGEAMACLNTFSPAEGPNSINCRVFETCGSGALMLCEHRPAVDACFDPGEEYLPFANFDQCLEQLDRLRRGDAEAGRIRHRAAKRAHAEHTYRHRLDRMLEILDLN